MATPNDATPSVVRVEQVGPGDWARWRTIRLRALAEAPSAFASTHGREVGRTEDAWRRLLASGTSMVAVAGDADIGLAGVHLADGQDQPQVFGMWVDPAWRGRGVGEGLVASLCEWARARGQSHLRLWVVAGNHAARALYRRVGFVDEADPTTPAPAGCEQAMVVTLEPDPVGVVGGPGIDDDALARVLDDLADRLGSAGIAWCLGGSSSRRIRGAARMPRDVDVVVGAEVVDALAVVLDDLRPADHPSPGNWRSDWLRAWHRPDGVVVEFIGGAAVVLGGSVVELPAEPAVQVDWRGRPRPLSDPGTWDRLDPGGGPSSRAPES